MQGRRDTLFSENFNSIRKEKGMSISDIGKETGIPITTLYDWANGRTQPKADKLKDLADVLGTSADELLA